jgi:hypothetical protein
MAGETKRPHEMTHEEQRAWWKGRIERREQAIRDAKNPTCPNCGRPGSHFAPPSLGEPGFYTCEEPIGMIGEVPVYEGDLDIPGVSVTIHHAGDLSGRSYGTPESRAAAAEADRRWMEFGFNPDREQDPIDLAVTRMSPFKAATGRLYFDSPLLKTPPSATGRWATCPAKWDYQNVHVPEAMKELNRKVESVRKRIINMNFAEQEARIVGWLMAKGGWPTEEDRIRYSIVAAARRKTDTALVTLAAAKVVDLSMERRYYGFHDKTTGVYHVDIESWDVGYAAATTAMQAYPSGVVYAPNDTMILQMLLNKQRVQEELMLRLGITTPSDYQKFNKRKR